MEEDFDEVLAEYEEDQNNKDEKKKEKETKKKGGYTTINSSGFADFLLKPEILNAVVDSGFEHPSEVQHRCIPQAILGIDVLCQAKSGMGKTAVFVLSVLQQIEPMNKETQCLVLCHTRELAFQISNEFIRFSKFLPSIKTQVFYGGIKIELNKNQLKQETPHIVVGTPGRISALTKSGDLKLGKCRYFVIDECDKVISAKKMRIDVQEIFKKTPVHKQVMMFSATMDDNIKKTAKNFMSNNPMEIYVDNESKLTLVGLQQYYLNVKINKKNEELNKLLKSLKVNQLVIFVATKQRAEALSTLLKGSGIQSIYIHGKMEQEERIKRYQSFKEFKERVLVATDLCGRGIDIERVNVVINYDMPEDSETYLHRVGRAGRFGTKGLAISFVIPEEDEKNRTYIGKRRNNSRDKPLKEVKVLEDIQSRFKVKMKVFPAEGIDPSTYVLN